MTGARDSRFRELDQLIEKAPAPVIHSFRNEAGEEVRFAAREMEVLTALVSGCESNKEIGARLGIAADSVRVYVHRLHRKLGLDNRVALALWAERNVKVAALAAVPPEQALCGRFYADGTLRCALPASHGRHASVGGAVWSDSSCAASGSIPLEPEESSR